MLIRNPMTEKELVKDIIDGAPDKNDNSGWAVAILASEDLSDLSLLNDVAEK